MRSLFFVLLSSAFRSIRAPRPNGSVEPGSIEAEDSITYGRCVLMERTRRTRSYSSVLVLVLVLGSAKKKDALAHKIADIAYSELASCTTRHSAPSKTGLQNHAVVVVARQSSRRLLPGSSSKIRGVPPLPPSIHHHPPDRSRIPWKFRKFHFFEASSRSVASSSFYSPTASITKIETIDR